MYILADFLWISDGVFLHWLLAIALTALVLDVFFQTEVVSWGALVAFAIWATCKCDLPTQWSVLLFIVFLGIAIALYCAVWKQLLSRFTNKVLMKNAPKEVLDGYVGGKGEICGEGSNMCVKYNTELHIVAEECRDGLTAGDKVIICEFKDGYAVVKPIQ
ncbi:MAG: hypothetical protein IKZ13_00700 [Akkermansia sp.]|nr:hypothetical protein [Akkermansia sp.]